MPFISLSHKEIAMLVAALIVMFCGVVTWLIFSLIAYSFIYGSLIAAYFLVWDDETRRAICPKGLWHTILYDE